MPRTEIAPAYQCYVSDQLADTAGLTLEQVGAYQILAWQAWRECGLPDDRAELARRVSQSPKRFEKICEPVLRAFTKCDDRLVLAWQEEQRARHKAWREKSRAGGLKSAERRRRADGGARVVEPASNPAVCSLPSASIPSPSTPPLSQTGGNSAKLQAEGLSLFAKIRKERVKEVTPSGIRYRIPSGIIEDLAPRALQALEVVGGPAAVAEADDVGLRVLRSQFATVYVGTE